MEKTFIAKTKNQIEIAFGSSMSLSGKIKSKYSVSLTSQGYAIVLGKSQIENILGVTTKHSLNYILLEDQISWLKWKYKAEKISIDYKKKNDEIEFNDLMKENAELNLIIIYAGSLKGIAGLPEKLKEKESIILNHIEFNLDPYVGEYGEWSLNIKVKDLLEKIKIAEKKELEKKEKNDEEKKQKELKSNDRIKEAFENELLIFGTEFLSRVNHILVHSIGAREENGEIKIYTTSYAKYIENANTSYHAKEELKKIGCNFSVKGKDWKIEANKENWEEVIKILKKYDSKANPRKLGLMQCGECGTWSASSNFEDDNYCGC